MTRRWVRVTPANVLDLSENLTLRQFRVEAKYTAARLNALPETRKLANDFEEAADKLALLEEEEARMAVQRAESQAMVETADDAWDDVMHALQRRLLDLSGSSTDHEIYRKYFADLPSQVTRLSYNAEIMISKDLERTLSEESIDELRSFAERLRSKREPLENTLVERTRMEVDEARFQNRVAMAKTILNKLRRTGHASLEEVGLAHGRTRDWAARFFHAKNEHLDTSDREGASSDAPAGAASLNGEASAITESFPEAPSA